MAPPEQNVPKLYPFYELQITYGSIIRTWLTCE
ncbi:hypothetical protein N748_16545 [Legionella pneumophila str. 121004]|nr:hypothetical protein N748_16545 [Legionella pneumophila str. 121004]ERH45716.1 hypothetical protein N750_06350 [Legionella pneumophila str. Leg01/53]ERH46460.1 hypothetical protein N751_07920 [Legionella pneumophila str. Leg01/11]ERI47240.1 hypothetical protein N749_15060 [Legionella pneumophila str. Leg01/20]